MFFPVLALTSSISILVLFRFFEKYQVSRLPAIIISYIISVILSFGFSINSLRIEQFLNYNSLLAIILGLSFFIGFISLSISTRQAGISITSIASNTSVLIPVIVAAIAYKEEIQLLQWIGLLLVIPAVYLFFKPKTGSLFNQSYLIFPLIIFIISGFNNSLLRQAENTGAQSTPLLFVGIIFFFALISSLVFTTVKKQSGKFDKTSIFFGILLGIFNFSSTFFFLKSLGVYHSALFFPIYNLSYIGIAALVGIVIFKEKFSGINLLGLVMAALAIGLMNW
jgi:drug/metabolite transporter (DMT)-like permease